MREADDDGSVLERRESLVAAAKQHVCKRLILRLPRFVADSAAGERLHFMLAPRDVFDQPR